MPSKPTTIFACLNCGAQSPKWSGRCLECGAWGTLKEELREKGGAEKVSVPAPELIDFKEVSEEKLSRFLTGIDEVDRVLGGGLVPGSLILLSGEPGIGKSTIVAQIAESLGTKELPVLYVSGEESAGQIKGRLQRLGTDLGKIRFLNETSAEKIAAAAEKLLPRLVIVDSIQTVYSFLVEAEAGGLNQIRATAARFLELAKQKNVAVILIGHVTKDGQLAGPKALEHLVDTVIYLETETLHDYRILRATKNRFGSVNEVGIFEMTGAGFKEIKNPSAIFLDEVGESLSGSVISSVMEGSRPFLVEVQALVTKTVFGYPQRKASGFDLNRLQVLSAVLTKRAKVNLSNQDIILNVVGGLKINDPALDLAVSAAIISSLLNQTVDRQTLVLGEVGLGGEIRNVSRLEQRLKEAEKLGFIKTIVPGAEIKMGALKIEKVKNLNDLLEKIKS